MFLTNSLESLVQSLCKTDETKFQYLESIIGSQYPGVDFKLLLRRGVFQYEFHSSYDKFNERALTAREAFFSTLRNEECQQVDYDYNSAC